MADNGSLDDYGGQEYFTKMTPTPGRMAGEDGKWINIADKFQNGVDVNVQDQNTDIISLFMAEVLDTITIRENTIKDDEVIKVTTTGYTPVVGNFLCLQESGKITQEEIITVTPDGGNDYTVEIAVPLDFPYTIDGGCSIQNVDINKDGSTTLINFINKPAGNFRWDITKINISMILSTAGDDGLFGNLSKLAKGVYFRKEDAGSSQNLFNIKENSDFRTEGNVVYPTRSSGGGSYGLGGDITFAGQSNKGVTIRVDGNLNESIKMVVRDDLTGLVKFRVKIQGHVVED